MRQSWSRRHDVVVLAACLAVLAAAPGLWWVLTPETQTAPGVASVGERPVIPPDDFASEPGPRPQEASPRSGPASGVARQSADATGSVAFNAVPALLLLPTLGLAAEVDRVGVRPDGQVDIPEDGDRIGWYRFGPAPGGAAGSSVLVGHRDTREAGPGVLYRLGEISVGDRVELVREDWGKIAYEVVARESLKKSTLPVDELFRDEGPPVLTIITCGGRYTPGVGYEENVVVTAVPLDEDPAV